MSSQLIEENSPTDNVYYNFTLRNPDPSQPFYLAKEIFFRVDGIVNRPSDWQIAVVRFKIPAFTVPIFIFPQDDPTYYQVILRYNNNDYVSFCSYNTTSFNDKNYTGAIFDISEFVQLVNTCYENSFNNMVAAEGAIVTKPPFINYDSSSQLMSLYVPTDYTTAIVYVGMNLPLREKFSGFQIITNPALYSDNSPVRFFSVYNKNGSTEPYDIAGINAYTYLGTDYYVMTDSVRSVLLISELESVILGTSNIPTSGELQSTTQNVEIKLLSDFEPGNEYDRSYFQFFPAGPLRFIDLYSNRQLKKMDISLSLKYRNQDVIPLYVPGTDVVSVKVRFSKKGVKITE